MWNLSSLPPAVSCLMAALDCQACGCHQNEVSENVEIEVILIAYSSLPQRLTSVMLCTHHT